MSATVRTIDGMTILNLTPHEVRLIRDGFDDVVFPPTGEPARLATVELSHTYVDGIPVPQVEFGHLDPEPPEVEGTYYIVSLPAALGSMRSDFLVPYGEIRDDAGRIVGCRELAYPV